MKTTETTQHTPGPWKTVISASTRAVTTSNEAPKQATICRLFSECVAFEPGEFEANARLIAAAPCLLSALKDMLSSANAGDLDSLANASEAAQEAISKAEGVQ